MPSFLRFFGTSPLTLAAALVLFAPAVLAAPDQITIESIPDQPFVTFDYAAATDFSGITRRDGDEYLIVSDKRQSLFDLRIEVDPKTGRIGNCAVTAEHPINSRFGDFEGVAFVPPTGRVFISAESGPGFLSVDLDGGHPQDIDPPSIFARMRPNKGLESLTFGQQMFWSANEESLEGDGPKSNPKSGTFVRLQKFDAAFQPVAQYAYHTDPSAEGEHGTGVSDLLLLPEGRLLVLERIVTPIGLAVGIFAVDPSDATNITKVRELKRGKFEAVQKTRLALIPTLATNFEGITCGPELADGWRSLILIADSGGARTHVLMPLRYRLTAADKPSSGTAR